MTTEWGALAGVFPPDKVTLEWLHSRADYLKRRDGKDHPRVNAASIAALERNLATADANAYYGKLLTLDLGTVTPHVSGPNDVKVMHSVAEMKQKQIKINKVITYG